MHAYDYEKQKWVSGPAAKPVRLAQLRQDLKLMTGEHAEAFARFSEADNPQETIEAIRREIATLETAVQP